MILKGILSVNNYLHSGLLQTQNCKVNKGQTSFLHFLERAAHQFFKHICASQKKKKEKKRTKFGIGFLF